MWRALVALLALGCSEPRWSDARTDLTRVPLAGWGGGGELFVVGGPLGSAGETLFLRRAGGSWSEVSTGTTATLWWAHGFSASDVWTVGEGGTVFHWNGSTLTQETVPTMQTLYGVWGVSSDDLWVVGGRPDISGVILHKTGATWTEMPALGNTGAYFKVWGAAADDVYACGQAGTVLHWDGSSWTPQMTSLPTFVSLFTVAGRGRDQVYAVGGLGEATALELVPPPDRGVPTWQPIADQAIDSAPALAGVAVAADGTVVMVGQGGTKLRGRLGSLADETSFGSRADFHAAIIDGDGSTIWAVGGNWLAPAGAARRGVILRYGE
jgi:hypothetical protein